MILKKINEKKAQEELEIKRKQKEKKAKHRGIMIGFGIFMSALGAIGGLLLAPKAGKEMRSDLSNTANKLKGHFAPRVDVIENDSEEDFTTENEDTVVTVSIATSHDEDTDK